MFPHQITDLTSQDLFQLPSDHIREEDEIRCTKVFKLSKINALMLIFTHHNNELRTQQIFRSLNINSSIW